MALTQNTIVDQITIDRNGSIFVRYGLQILDGTREISCAWHRSVFHPGDNIDAQTGAINNDLAQHKLGLPVPAAETNKIKTHASIVWTPEVIAAAKSRRQAQI